MKEDIEFIKVQDIAVCAIPESEDNFDLWHVYILNLKDKAIDGVLISSKGYGKKDGNKVATSVFRHHIEKMEAQSFSKIESLHTELLGLANEFWVSFWQDGVIRDKKYIFVRESIRKENLTQIPLINKKGVMIK